jgi:hypothetical protein
VLDAATRAACETGVSDRVVTTGDVISSRAVSASALRWPRGVSVVSVDRCGAGLPTPATLASRSDSDTMPRTSPSGSTTGKALTCAA